MLEVNIKRCRCGCTVEVDCDEPNLYKIRCSECMRRVMIEADSIEECIQLWNERYSVDTVIRDLEGIKQFLKASQEFLDRANEQSNSMQFPSMGKNVTFMLALEDAHKYLRKAIHTIDIEIDWRKR